MADSTPHPHDGEHGTGSAPGEGSATFAPTDQPTPVTDTGRYQDGEVRDAHHRLLRDRTLDREVLARIAPLSEADELEQEARFLARLDHLNAPGILDFVRSDTGAMLVTRKNSGITLAEAIRRSGDGHMSPELASPAMVVQTICKVCDVIATVHSQGVVHHDLSPDVILLGGHGQVIVHDWSAAIAERRNPTTLRYVSAAAATPAAHLSLDGLHDDIHALGACLAECLLLRPLKPTATDPLGNISLVERQRLPAALEAVIRQALASNRSTGYRSVSDLAQDLTSYLEGLAPAAYVPGPMARFGEWVRLRQKGLLVAASLCVLLGVAVGAIWGKQLWTMASWRVVVAEDFSNPEWKQRWIEPPSINGMFAVDGNAVVSTAERDAFLIFRQRLTTPAAIEYTGEIQAGSQPCDLSVQWSEASGIAEDPAQFAQTGRSYMIQAGAFGNSLCAIFQNPGRRLLAYANRQLEVGRPYRFRVELDGTRITMLIDGVQVLEHHDIFPTQSGFISLYAFYPGKAFTDVRVFQGSPANEPTPLATGDTAFLERRFAAATDQYARVAELSAGMPIQQQALYRKGLAQWNLGETELASRDWNLVTDPELVAQIDCIRIEALFTTDQRTPQLSRFEEQYRDRPEMRDRLRRTWIMLIQQQLDAPQPNPMIIPYLLNVRERLFPDDESARYVAAITLLATHRYEEVLEKFPDQRNPCARALLSLGRSDQVLESEWVGNDERVHALSMRGEFAKLLELPGLFPSTRVRSLIHIGRAEEALSAEGGTHSALLHLGRAAEALAQPNLKGSAANEALICLGRLQEAAGAGLPQVSGSGSDVTAMLMLGQVDLAELAAKRPRPAIRFMQAAENGNDQDYARFHDQIALPPDLGGPTGWFAPLILRPFVDVLQGDATAFDHQTRPHLDLMSGIYTRTPWFVTRAILGLAPIETVLEMPRADEAETWRLLCVGIKAELDDQPDVAAASYTAFKALPMHRRLLSGNLPDAEVEWFVSWRLRALSGKKPSSGMAP